MRDAKRISAVHQAVATAAVKAVLGERAVIREMVELPSSQVPLGAHVVAMQYGIRTFFSRWTGRKSNGSSITDETED